MGQHRRVNPRLYQLLTKKSQSPFPRTALKALQIQASGRTLLSLWDGSASEIYCPDLSFEHLYDTDREHPSKSWEFIARRSVSVAHFLRTLEIAWDCEINKWRKLTNLENINSLIPRFEESKRALIESVKTLHGAIPDFVKRTSQYSVENVESQLRGALFEPNPNLINGISTYYENPGKLTCY